MFQYRTDYFLALVGILAQVFLLKAVWTVLYREQPQLGGVPLETMIAYATLATVQYTLFNPWSFSPLPQRVREGKISSDLLRPVSLPAQIISGQVGATVAMLPLAIAVIPLAAAVGSAAVPRDGTAMVGYIVSLVLAYVLTQQLALLVGSIVFWTLEVGGVFMIYRMATQFFSGALVPLWAMPDPVGTVIGFLPFQATVFTPSAIYLGQIHGPDTLHAVGIQLLWIAVVYVTIRIVWSRAIHRVVVQGG